MLYHFLWLSATHVAEIPVQIEFAASALTILECFGLKNHVEKLLPQGGVHDVRNLLSLEPNCHTYFDKLNLWFERSKNVVNHLRTLQHRQLIIPLHSLVVIMFALLKEDMNTLFVRTTISLPTIVVAAIPLSPKPKLQWALTLSCSTFTLCVPGSHTCLGLPKSLMNWSAKSRPPGCSPLTVHLLVCSTTS